MNSYAFDISSRTSLERKLFPTIRFQWSTAWFKPFSYLEKHLGCNEVVRNGTQWAQLINVWDDKWLLGSRRGIIASPRVDSILRVFDLLLPGSMLWDEDLIDSVFHAKEVLLIKSISLSFHSQEDCLIWKGEHLGVFTIRSGYCLLLPTPTIESMR